MSDLEVFALDWIIRSAVVLGAIGFGLFCCRKWTSPALRFTILQITFFAVCLMPIIPQVMPKICVFPRVEGFAMSENLSIERSTVADPSPVIAEAGPTIGDQQTELTFPPLFASIWIVGSVLLVARLCVSGVTLARLWRRTPFRVENSVRIVLGDSHSRPMIWGVLRPLISLPAEATQWPESTRESVIAHELAHHARRDPLWLLVSEVVLSLAWINPVLWILRAWKSAERERATDDFVLMQSSIHASDYAEALTRLADKRWKSAFTLAPAIAMGSAIRARAIRALDRDAARATPGRGTIVYLVASVLATTAVASLLAQEQFESVALQVVIDPGHGAHDAGAKRGGFQEKDLNLYLSNVIADYLKEGGATVMMTRDDDAFLTLGERAEIAEKAAADFEGETILISIHHNAGRTINESGIELYLMEGDEKSVPLGKSIEGKLKSELGAKSVSTRATRMLLLRETRIPRVMIEAGYMSNPGDLAKVTSDEYRKLMGEAIASGIMRKYRKKVVARGLPSGELPFADGFDHPVGAGEMTGFDSGRGYEPSGHLSSKYTGTSGWKSILGLPVTSVGNGVVIYAKRTDEGWGNVVITRHRYRDPVTGEIKMIDALYGHLGRMFVEKGDRITRQQKIGTIGRGPYKMDYAYLHFEIRKNLEIGMERAAFSRGFENYHLAANFINNHRPGKMVNR